MILRTICLIVAAALLACCNPTAASDATSEASAAPDELAQLSAMAAQNAAVTRKLETLEARLHSGSVVTARTGSAARDTPRIDPLFAIDPAQASSFSGPSLSALSDLTGSSEATASLGATSTAPPAWASYPPLLRVDNSEMRLSQAASQRLHRLRDTTPGYAARAAEDLVAWLRSMPGGGGFVGPARIEPMPPSATQSQHCEDCRLVSATRDLHPGETLVSIPRAALFDAATAYASEWTNTRKLVLQSWPHLDAQTIWIAVALLYDYARMPAFRDGVAVDYGAEPSPFAPFYATLPLDFSSHPILFDMGPDSGEDPHVWLRGSPVLNSIRERVVELDDESHDLVEALRDKGLGVLFKQSHYAWAKLVVLTRTFAINTSSNPLHPSPHAPDRTLLTLAPFADMLNHASTPDALWEFDESMQQFRMTYTRSSSLPPLKAGEPISTTYGSRNNRQLFITYGFVVEEGTVHDDMVVSLRVDRPDTRTMSTEEKEDALSLWRQRVHLLQLLHPEGWLNSTDVNALVLSPLERRASGLAPESYNVFRCLFTARDVFGRCFSFARIAVASPAELLALFTKDLPACPTVSFQQAPIGWTNEVRAVRMLAAAAQEALEAYAQVAFDGHPVQDERERLRMHQRAMDEGLCDPSAVVAGESKFASARRRQALGCLSFIQRNMLLLRAGEKDLLSMFRAIGGAVTRFTQDPPTSWTEGQRWLASHVPPSENRTAAFVYVDQILLPLWNRKQGWRDPAMTDTRSASAAGAKEP